MFCGKCGTKINDGDSFCTNCGAKVQTEIDDFDIDNGDFEFTFENNDEIINEEADEEIDLKKDILKMSLKELKLKKQELQNENIKLENELKQLPDQYHVPAGAFDPAEVIGMSIYNNETESEKVSKLIDDIINNINNFDEAEKKINDMTRDELLVELKMLESENRAMDRNIEKEKIKAEYNDKLIKIVKENIREWYR